MIALLRGNLLEKHPNRVLVDVQGVGYDVQVPLSTFYRLPESGCEVTLRTHTHVREDALALFGFATVLELRIFERLISISGIGPRLALAVLSGIEVGDLTQSVQLGDVARLTAIPGIGRKTAERIVLELRDKLPEAVEPAVGESQVPVAGTGGLRADLLSALLNLGYHRSLAEKAVNEAVKSAGDVGFERLLKQALGELNRH
ncbi:MAG: Holliday junction branch migration protein RuvA [Vicinamibacterales bacterium]